MENKYHKIDGGYFMVVMSEDKEGFDIAEYSSLIPIHVDTIQLSLPSLETAQRVCEALVETFEDGRSSCECF